MVGGNPRTLGTAIFVIGLLGVLIGLVLAYYAVVFGAAGAVLSASLGALGQRGNVTTTQAGVQSVLVAGRGMIAALICLVALLGAGLGLRFPFAGEIFLGLAAVAYGAALWVFGLIPTGFMLVASILGVVEALTAEPRVSRQPVPAPPTPPQHTNAEPFFKPLKGHL
jgi:hypothetical protein